MKRALIIGNALLFGALGCDDVGTGAVGDAGDDATVRADAASDASAAPDAAGGGDDQGLGDLGPARDVGPQPDNGPSPDAEPPLDMDPQTDQGPLPDGMILDEGPGLDQSVDLGPMADLGEQVDLGAEPDLGGPLDEGPPPGACASLMGGPCGRDGEACCPDGPDSAPGAMCQSNANGELVWGPPFSDLCYCYLVDGLEGFDAACAVPGFVGITRSGRRARKAQAVRLRGLALAA